ncbi:hypothetical protein QQ020_35175 [Fulvivirgaceae bacterium BMA12]|uniref:Tetratricopeptide repeat protein n=1 Tax=Agaribacillus aureus TaxID=3051825 RepID=A0ABT8LKX3_9BACT|nr:hypothetical protein [Fulvivirgaceae bacterium BMA12]
MSRITFIIAMALAIGLSVPLQATPHPWAHLSLPQQAEAIKEAIDKLQAKDHDEIIDLAGLLHQIGQKLEDHSIMAEAIRQQAWAYGKKQDLTKSARYYFELEQLYRQLNNNGGLGKAYFNIGKLFARAHEYDEALRYYALAKDHYAAAGLDDKVSMALYQMGWCHLDKQQPDVATGLLKEALKTCSEQNKKQKSEIYNLLGWTAKDMGDHHTARHYYRQSLQPLDDSDKWAKKRAIAMNNIGESFLLEGHHDSAAIYLQKALEMKAILKDPEFSLSTMVSLAEMDYQRGLYIKAVARLEAGLKDVDPTNLSNQINEALALLTTIAQDQKVNISFPGTLLQLGMQQQRQQFLALQKLKGELDKFSIKAGQDLYTHEMESQKLEASLVSQRHQKYRWSTASAFLLCVALIGFIYARIQKKYKTRAEKDKKEFVNEQMKNYDQRILQMLIVKAEYEEIKSKLKRDFGLGDVDFPGQADG